MFTIGENLKFRVPTIYFNLKVWKEQWIFSLIVVSSFILSYICLDLRILISCRQAGKMYLTHISDSCYYLIWYLGARNIKLSIIESYCLWGVDICICSFQYCFLIYGMFDSATVALNSISPIFLQVKKKSLHQTGFESTEDIHCVRVPPL